MVRRRRRVRRARRVRRERRVVSRLGDENAELNMTLLVGLFLMLGILAVAANLSLQDQATADAVKRLERNSLDVRLQSQPGGGDPNSGGGAPGTSQPGSGAADQGGDYGGGGGSGCPLGWAAKVLQNGRTECCYPGNVPWPIHEPIPPEQVDLPPGWPGFQGGGNDNPNPWPYPGQTQGKWCFTLCGGGGLGGDPCRPDNIGEDCPWFTEDGTTWDTEFRLETKPTDCKGGFMTCNQKQPKIPYIKDEWHWDGAVRCVNGKKQWVDDDGDYCATHTNRECKNKPGTEITCTCGTGYITRWQKYIDVTITQSGNACGPPESVGGGVTYEHTGVMSSGVYDVIHEPVYGSTLQDFIEGNVYITDLGPARTFADAIAQYERSLIEWTGYDVDGNRVRLQPDGGECGPNSPPSCGGGVTQCDCGVVPPGGGSGQECGEGDIG
jgi:hypothetical protein